MPPACWAGRLAARPSFTRPCARHPAGRFCLLPSTLAILRAAQPHSATVLCCLSLIPAYGSFGTGRFCDACFLSDVRTSIDPRVQSVAVAMQVPVQNRDGGGNSEWRRQWQPAPAAPSCMQGHFKLAYWMDRSLREEDGSGALHTLPSPPPKGCHKVPGALRLPTPHHPHLMGSINRKSSFTL